MCKYSFSARGALVQHMAILITYKCKICDYNYFFIQISFQRCACDGCHCLLQKMSFKEFAIFSGEENDYRIHLWGISKNEAASLMKISDLNEKSEYINE